MYELYLLQLVLKKNVNYNFSNFDKTFFLIFFQMLKKKKQYRKNLLLIKINVTKRNVFTNVFTSLKKPSVFVFTAGQTKFEGKLKKSKQAGMLLGRKIWKFVVTLSKKFFVYSDFSFGNFQNLYHILKKKKNC